MNEKATGVLLSSRIYRNYTKAFTAITGLPLSLRPLETARGPGCRKWSSDVLGRQSTRCKLCGKGLVRIVGRSSSRGAVIECTNGCCGGAVPVRSGRDVIAFLKVGPVNRSVRLPRLAGISDKLTRKEASKTVEHSPGPRAFRLVPFSPRQCRAALTLLGIFAEHLGDLCNRMLVQKQSEEPPAISRAKDFISHHYSENLSSGRVAKEVHLSRYYFCKLFKNNTGLTFTAYLARVRVERIKELLLNPNLRITEIAFHTGFQSLTHFNRVFRGLTGRSPTEFRARLLKL